MFNDKKNGEPTPMKVDGPYYIVRQVVLSEAFIGTGSKDSSLDYLQNIINS